MRKPPTLERELKQARREKNLFYKVITMRTRTIIKFSEIKQCSSLTLFVKASLEIPINAKVWFFLKEKKIIQKIKETRLSCYMYVNHILYRRGCSQTRNEAIIRKR